MAERSMGELICALRKEKGLTQRELAEKMCVKPPSMTVALQKMEKNEYVTRKPDQEDQRIIRITLTEKGKNWACPRMRCSGRQRSRSPPQKRDRRQGSGMRC